MADLIIGGVIVFMAGSFCGGALAMVFQQRAQIEVLKNIVQYGRPEPPKASVYYQGDPDPEVEATIKLREREHDALTTYLQEQGIDPKKASEEAGRMLRESMGSS